MVRQIGQRRNRRSLLGGLRLVMLLYIYTSKIRIYIYLFKFSVWHNVFVCILFYMYKNIYWKRYIYIYISWGFNDLRVPSELSLLMGETPACQSSSCASVVRLNLRIRRSGRPLLGRLFFYDLYWIRELRAWAIFFVATIIYIRLKTLLICI